MSHPPPGHPGSLTWSQLDWEDDDHAQYAVEMHPDGLSAEEIGDLMGVSADRVEQIQADAIRSFCQSASRMGIDFETAIKGLSGGDE